MRALGAVYEPRAVCPFPSRISWASTV